MLFFAFGLSRFSLGICVSYLLVILHPVKRDSVVLVVKNPPAMQETWVPSLGWEDSLEKEMATHSGTLARKIPWLEEPGRLHGVSKGPDAT